MKSKYSQRLKKLQEAAHWRGLLITGLLGLREIFRPLIYWDIYNIYETDISERAPEAYGEEEVEVKIYASEDGLTITHEQISAELEKDHANFRFARGDLVGIAYLNDEPVGYMWIALTSGVDLGLDARTYWTVRSGEAVRYGSFVSPAFRGRGIHSCLNTAVNAYLRCRGVTRALGAVSLLNPQSLSLPKHYNRAIAMTVFVARIRGTNWTLRKSFRAPLSGRFYWRKLSRGAV